MQRFLITGCPRSGTKFIADLLSNLGIKCGWEQIYNYDIAAWGEGVVGESSWLSVQHFDVLPEDVIVLHQVRYPPEVIKSMMHWTILESGKDKAHASRTTNKPERYVIRGSERRQLIYERFWVDINNIIAERAVYRWKVEDIDFEIYNLLDIIKIKVPEDKIKKELESINRKINSGHYKGPKQLKDPDAIKLAESYGYKL